MQHARKNGASGASIGTAAFKGAMRRLAGGVSILASRHAGARRGLTATAVCSLSADPPSLLACVNQSAEAHELIMASRLLSVNVLAGHHQYLADTFAGQDGTKGEKRFSRGEWGVMATGAPCLKDALACFDCKVFDHHRVGSHSVFFCHVVAVAHAPREEPLIYFDTGFAGLGIHSIHRLAHEVGEWL